MNAKFLSHFTPSLMTPEALEAIFVQREKLAARLVEWVRDSALTPAKHYTLLVGPRGIGKTHLVSLVYHRVRAMEDLGERLLVAWLREEEWGVTSFLDLLLRIFRALQAETNDAALAARVEALYELPSADAERAAAALLQEIAGDRTLLVLAENLDDLFAGLGDAGQKRLRAYLQENPFWTILATTQSLFGSVSLQTSPFYGFFRIQHLGELDLEDAARLLVNIAQLEGDDELAAFIQTLTGRARIRAVHHLAGGNPRVYVIFSQFLIKEALDDLIEPVMRTLDDLTPYYQARMSWLSPQQRKIVELLCDRRHAVPVKEIAQRCFITHQTASSQLKELREKGYVRSEPHGRDSFYELREPLMRMSMEVKKQRSEPIRLLVDFLRLFFLPSEIRQQLELLQSQTMLKREYLLHALRAAEEEAEDPRVVASLRDLDTHLEVHDFASALQAAEELIAIRGDATDWARKGYCLLRLRRFEEALVSSDSAIQLDPTDCNSWGSRAEVLYSLGRLGEALTSVDRAIELDSSQVALWAVRGQVMEHLSRHEEALACYERAVEIKPDDAADWAHRGMLLAYLGHSSDALASCEKALELDPTHGMAFTTRGTMLGAMGRYEEALIFLEKAIALGDRRIPALWNYAEASFALKRWDEGAAALDEAISQAVRISDRELGDTPAIVRNLFTTTREPEEWRLRSSTLVELYEKHHALSWLAQGVVKSVSALASPMVSDAAARAWLEAWREAAGDRAELQLPLRLLDAAVRYRETRDPRVLLGLPAEERALLEPLLGEGGSSAG